VCLCVSVWCVVCAVNLHVCVFCACMYSVQCILESIQTPWLITHFVRLQPYSKMHDINLHTIPIMTKQKWVFIKCCTFVKNKQLKYYIYISIQNLSLPSTFGSDYSLESSWVWRYKLGTPVFGELLPFFPADPLKLCQVGWGALLHSYFQVYPEMFDWVQALAGLLNYIQRLVSKPLLRCA
jgi:hypothetical protein